MTIRLSTGLRNKMLDGGTTGGIKGAFNLGFMNVYSGTQPATADAVATGTLLGTVSVNGGGTGVTFDAAAAGVISKAAAETWRFTGLADGTAGWFRLWPAAGNPAILSTTEARLDGSIGTSGADANINNLTVATGGVTTVDSLTVTMPAS